MSSFFLDRDPLSGARETFEYDEGEERAIIKRCENVEPILNRNKALANEGDGYSADRTLRRAASIPMAVVLLWRECYGVDVLNKDHWPAVRRLLNDPDWRYLRTAPGTL